VLTRLLRRLLGWSICAGIVRDLRFQELRIYKFPDTDVWDRGDEIVDVIVSAVSLSVVDNLGRGAGIRRCGVDCFDKRADLFNGGSVDVQLYGEAGRLLRWLLGGLLSRLGGLLTRLRTGLLGRLPRGDLGRISWLLSRLLSGLLGWSSGLMTGLLSRLLCGLSWALCWLLTRLSTGLL